MWSHFVTMHIGREESRQPSSLVPFLLVAELPAHFALRVPGMIQFVNAYFYYRDELTYTATKKSANRGSQRTTAVFIGVVAEDMMVFASRQEAVMCKFMLS
jgi:hypothetical protein